MGETTTGKRAADGWWWSRDGLRLHYREHGGGVAGRPAILCIPGLTRNARDFDGVAARLAGWRVIAVDLRGRGESAQAKDPMTYVPLTYLQDIEALIETLGLTRFVLFGTSLGGIVAMLLAATGRDSREGGRLAGVLLNDVGPQLDPRGLGRIRAHVGRGTVFPTWLHAARAIAEAQAPVHPGFALPDWIAMAKRLCRLTPAGRIMFDYDMRIVEPMRIAGADDAVDLWPAAEALRGVPGALIRGALSDVLSAGVADEMAARIGLEQTIVPNVGHAPTLDEPEAAAAIDRLLARVVRGLI